jgi:toxin ParE1/3/4
MSAQQLKQEAMALSLSERVSLAQELWASIDAGLADTDERDAVREAIRRDQELSSGAVVGRTHDQVMQTARRALGCDWFTHPEAEAELIEAARFYERRVSTLGAQFLDAPDRWSMIEADVRHYIMPRFPYAIYYRVLPDHVRILAFKHHSRHPDYWRSRLSE